MKILRVITLCLSMTVFVSSIAAHESARPLPPGGLAVSWLPTPMMGGSYSRAFSFDADGTFLSLINAQCFLYNPTGPGEIASIEWAPFERLSFGVKTPLFVGWLHGFRDGDWNIPLSILARATLVDGEDYTLNAIVENLWQPLYWANGDRHEPGAGFVVLFGTMSSNLRLLGSKGPRLYAYLDAKLIATYKNPFLDLYPFRQSDNILPEDLPPGTKIDFQVGQTYRGATALGLEFEAKAWSVHIGWNVNIYDYYAGDSKLASHGWSFLFDPRIDAFELGWRYRLRP